MTARPFISSLLPDSPVTVPTQDSGGLQVPDRRLGDILRAMCGLSDEQMDRIVQHQRLRQLRIGQAAISLRMVSPADVSWALSQQFQYTWVRDNEVQVSDELVMALNPFGPDAEAFRELRAQLMTDPQIGRRPIAVLSPSRGDGKSYLAANLAIAFSQLGANTLLIDANLRRARQQKLFNLHGGVGLSTLLAERGPRGAIQRAPGLPDLHVLPAGLAPPNPLELLQRASFNKLMQDLSATFDYVVVDTPAMERGADARVVAAQCRAAVAVGRKGLTRMLAMRRLVAATRGAGAHVAGVVINTF